MGRISYVRVVITLLVDISAGLVRPFIPLFLLSVYSKPLFWAVFECYLAQCFGNSSFSVIVSQGGRIYSQVGPFGKS
jgi:hypothetical protein